MSIDIGQFFLDEHFKHSFTENQLKQFSQLMPLYKEWNEKVNVISRKDIDSLYLHHVLHSLLMTKYIRFDAGAKVLDIGTGGGFPGIPLAIFYPEVDFILVDSMEKKIKVVVDIIQRLGLTNATAIRSRAEELDLEVDYVVSRATAPMNDLVRWTRKQLKPGQKGSLPNGWVALKGGDLKEELIEFRRIVEVSALSKFSGNEYFESKKLVYIARQIL